MSNSNPDTGESLAMLRAMSLGHSIELPFGNQRVKIYCTERQEKDGTPDRMRFSALVFGVEVAQLQIERTKNSTWAFKEVQ